jgi:hypothetical protein
MKKTMFAVAIAVIGVFMYANSVKAVGYVKDTFRVMQSMSGKEVLHPGAMVKTKAYFASTDEAQICTGKCAIFDIISTSGADGAYAIVYDSAPATAGTATIFSKLEFDGTGIAKGLPANGLPFVTTNGLAVDLSSVSGGESLLILYKDMD